jgi:uncharacterized membrane protein YkoI
MGSAPRLAISTLFLGTLFLLGALPAFVPARGEDGVRPAHVEEAPHPAAPAVSDTAHDAAAHETTAHDSGHETAPHETAHETVHACLDQRERRAEAGKIVPLSAAMRTARARMPGTVVRARLCRGSEGLVYVLTVLARDGKVARLTVDAVKGTLVGGL